MGLYINSLLGLQNLVYSQLEVKCTTSKTKIVILSRSTAYLDRSRYVLRSQKFSFLELNLSLCLGLENTPFDSTKLTICLVFFTFL